MTSINDLPNAYIERSETPTALIIEDDMTTIRLIKHTAEYCGWKIIPILSVTEMSSILHIGSIQLIISDDNIYGGNIDDTFNHLKQLESKPPVYVISAAEPERLEQISQHGKDQGLDVKGYLQKPFQISDIQAIFEAHNPDKAKA